MIALIKRTKLHDDDIAKTRYTIKIKITKHTKNYVWYEK